MVERPSICETSLRPECNSVRNLFHRDSFLKHLCLDGGASRGDALADLEAGLQAKSVFLSYKASVWHPYVHIFSKTHLLPESHNLEALKVGELLPLDGALTVLCPGAVVPCLLNTRLLPGSLEGGVAGGTGKLLDDDGGKGDVGERDGVTGDGALGLGGRTLNQDLFLV